MSEMEYHVGMIKKYKTNKNLESACKEICEKEGWVLVEHGDTYKDLLEEEGYDSKKYLIINDEIYCINDTELSNTFFYSNKIKDDIFYLVGYYNGGCSFTDAIEEAMINTNEVKGV